MQDKEKFHCIESICLCSKPPNSLNHTTETIWFIIKTLNLQIRRELLLDRRRNTDWMWTWKKMLNLQVVIPDSYNNLFFQGKILSTSCLPSTQETVCVTKLKQRHSFLNRFTNFLNLFKTQVLFRTLNYTVWKSFSTGSMAKNVGNQLAISNCEKVTLWENYLSEKYICCRRWAPRAPGNLEISTG